jgi:alanyl-tRNA synthetase
MGSYTYKVCIMGIAGREDEYKLEFFRSKGFVRKKCVKCGEYFWTLNPELENCQDAPCSPYFFDKISVKTPLSVRESREKFLKFFEERGHKIIAPKPVVARWREDLYLTIASIVDFQPHVTNGITPPPANPLVISQPCIRLEDIDHVGLTMGRHLTLFEMGGHHAFNKKDGDWIYWKDETLEYAFEFFTKTIGVPEELLVFKESWWTGGGNAGPSFEVAAGGLELATLVFMKYRTTENGGLEPIPLQIVDTGYGIERISWFTQKTPTAFHAIYGELVDSFRSLLGLPLPPKDFYRVAFINAGLLDPDDPKSIKSFITQISETLGTDYNDARKMLEKEVRLYTLLDHTKTLSYMLADGIVPSNQGEGYLARLVARRALKTLYLLENPVSLTDLVEKQIELWRKDYPRLWENRDYIVLVTGLEEKRFKALIKERLPRAVSILIKNPDKSVMEKIYRETGLPPEILAGEAAKRGRIIEVPPDFYSRLASQASGSIGREKKEKKAEWIRGCPTTERIFHENPYAIETDATVLCIHNEKIILDKTVMYPTGGGQVSDHGLIIKGDTSYKVINVEKIGDHIIHYLESGDHDLKNGDKVRVVIDWDRRYRNMRHHTATHILIGSLRKVLGKHVWQAGAEKTPEKARLDFTHYELPTENELMKIEDLANKVILDRIPVRTMVLDKNEAEERYGYSIYQGGVPLSRWIRIVEIPGHDAEACFGTHVHNTSEVGGIKIISATKLQDGIIRIEYVAGTQLAEYSRKLEKITDESAKKISAQREILPKRIESLLEERENLKKLLSKYRSEYYKELREKLLKRKTIIDGNELIIYTDTIGDEKSAQELLKKLVRENPLLTIVRLYQKDNAIYIEISMGEQISQTMGADALAKKISEKIGGKGGGKKDHVVLRIEKRVDEEEVESILKEAMKELRGSMHS